MSKLEQYKEKLRFDRDALDDCLSEQPFVFQEVSERCARMISKRDAQKDEYKRIRADLFVQIKSSSEGSKRITDSEATAQIDMHPKYLEAHRRYIELCEQAAKWESLKDAFVQRSHAIRDMVRLTATDSYASDRIVGAEEENRQRKAESAMAARSEGRVKKKGRKGDG